MVKLTENQGRAVLLVLLRDAMGPGGALLEPNVDQVATVFRNLRHRVDGLPGGHQSSQLVRTVLHPESEQLPENAVVETIKDLFQQLKWTDEDERQDTTSKPLMEAVADLLSDPYARQRMTDEKLEKLRKVVLRPDEHRFFTESLKGAYACAKCGEKFADREAVTTVKNGKTTTFFCLQCMHPNNVRCAHRGCKKHASAVTITNKRRCDDHLYGDAPVAGKAKKKLILERADTMVLRDMLAHRISSEPPTLRWTPPVFLSEEEPNIGGFIDLDEDEG